MIEIAEASASGRQAVAQLYAQAGYGAPIEAGDRVMVATLEGQLVGAVRLCCEHGVMVLRGMQVRNGFQRLGIGSRLLEACLPWLDRGVVFCLPYAHLTGFYGAAGFEVLGADGLPAFLAQRLDRYLAQGQNVVAMRRAVAPA
ncbi:MAG TPA: GNAT family N-acetyltransferase [Telluria sp.]